MVPVEAAIYKPESSKPIPEFYKNVKVAKEVLKKDLEEKMLNNNSGKTVTEPELFTTNIAMINPAVKSSEPKTQDTTYLQQAI